MNARNVIRHWIRNGKNGTRKAIMFGWMKRLREGRSTPEDLAQAHQQGRELGQQMTEALDAYLAILGCQIGETYLPILQQRLPVLLAGENEHPEEVAQDEWLKYLREMSAVEQRLLQEVPAQMSDAFTSADIVGIRPQLDEYLTQQVEATAQRAAVEAAFVIVRELAAVRAARGLVPLELSSEDFARELSGLRTAYVMAHEAAGALRQAVSDHLESRMLPIQRRYLNAFRQRLRTIHDSPPHPAAAVAMVEWDIFRQNVSEMREKLRDELDRDLSEWLNLATLGGLRSDFDEMIDQRIGHLAETLETEGKLLLEAAVAGVGGSPEQLD